MTIFFFLKSFYYSQKKKRGNCEKSRGADFAQIEQKDSKLEEFHSNFASLHTAGNDSINECFFL